MKIRWDNHDVDIQPLDAMYHWLDPPCDEHHEEEARCHVKNRPEVRRRKTSTLWWYRQAQCSVHRWGWLLYIELTISFLIGRKRTVNFRNQRLWRHLAADYTIIMSRTLKVNLKVTGNLVMYNINTRFGFLLSKTTKVSARGYQPQASADNPYLDLDYSGYHKNLIQSLFITV